MNESVLSEAAIVRLMNKAPMERLVETEDSYAFATGLTINRRHPLFADGFASDLFPESHFYKRCVAHADGGQAVVLIFRAHRPAAQPGQLAEYVAGWVTPDREEDVDQWVTFLNAEIRERLVGAGIAPEYPGARDGIIRIRERYEGGRRVLVLGDFREARGNDDPEAPSILAAIGSGRRGPSDRAALAAYLRRAPAASIAMGAEIDLLDPSRYAGSATVRSDGHYAWPDTLAHYVELDDVGLPSDFEAHVRRMASAPTDAHAATEPETGASRGTPAKPPRRLAIVGNFRELGFLRAIDGAPPPSFIAARGKSGRKRTTTEYVARYLRGGWEIGPRMQRRGDVFEPGVAAGYTGLLTDGAYAWPHLLAHYVERYDVALPAEFEERMRKRVWTPPMAIDTNALTRP